MLLPVGIGESRKHAWVCMKHSSKMHMSLGILYLSSDVLMAKVNVRMVANQLLD